MQLKCFIVGTRRFTRFPCGCKMVTIELTDLCVKLDITGTFFMLLLTFPRKISFLDLFHLNLSAYSALFAHKHNHRQADKETHKYKQRCMLASTQLLLHNQEFLFLSCKTARCGISFTGMKVAVTSQHTCFTNLRG